MRCFICFDVEDEGVLDRLVEAQRILLQSGVKMKAVERENLHITMKFLGEVPPPMVEAVKTQMAEVRFEEFEAHIKGVGAFPKTSSPRVIWAGVEEGAEKLKAVYEELERRLRRLGFKPEGRPFHPHVTLMRVKGPRSPQLVRRMMELSDYEFGTVRCDALRLKKSTLTPRGPVYETLFEVRAVRREP